MKRYKQYLEDPTLEVPRATRYRRQRENRFRNANEEISTDDENNSQHASIHSNSDDDMNTHADQSTSTSSNMLPLPSQSSQLSASIHETSNVDNVEESHLSNQLSHDLTIIEEEFQHSISNSEVMTESWISSDNGIFGIEESDNSNEEMWLRDVYEEILEDTDEEIDLQESYHNETNTSFEEQTFTRLRNIINNDECNEPLNVNVSMSECEILLAVIKYSISYNLSQSGIADLFKMINCILGVNMFPETRYLVDKVFNSDSHIDFHAICSNCKNYIKKFNRETRKLTCSCGNVVLLKDPTYTDFFATINVENKIGNLVKYNYEHVQSVIAKRLEETDTYTDITDGTKYKNFMKSLPLNESNQCLSATFNTDGSPLFESSKVSIWPIQIVINELPFLIRSKNPIVCGLWFGKDKPNMQIFLKSFVNLMNKLSTEGIKLKINDVETVFKCYVLCSCVDSVARAPMQGMVQYNGYNGCGWCHHPGVYVQTSQRGGSVKYPLLDHYPEERTMLETLHKMKASLTSAEPINGIKNPSPLINLTAFDIIAGFVPDSMHNVCLGIAEQFLKYWIKNLLSRVDIQHINEVLAKIQVPSRVARLTRTLSDRSFWKAREYENWVLYYSIPILCAFEHMQQYVQHWSLLVEAFYLLSKDSMSIREVEKANNKLKNFVAYTEYYYGTQAMTYNIHQLLHMAQSVVNWGPLWAHNGYCFESGNGKLVRKVQAAKGVIYQLCRLLSFSESEILLQDHNDLKEDSKIQKYVSYLDKKLCNTSLKLSQARYFGPYKLTHRTHVEQMRLSNGSRSYHRIVKDQCVYTSYKRRTQRSDNSIASTKNDNFIRLLEFIVDERTRKEYTLCNFIATEDIFDSLVNVKKIVSVSNNIDIIHTNYIDKVCVTIHNGSDEYLCFIPNLQSYCI